MSIKKIIQFCLIVVLTGNCVKDESGTDSLPCKYNSYQITLTPGLQFSKVVFYQSDTLVYKMDYSYLPNLIKTVKKDKNNVVLSVSRYYLNYKNLADSCIDSAFYSSILNVILSKYQYDNNDYKIAGDFISKSIVNDTITSISANQLTYQIADGNLVSYNINGYCSEFFEYNDLQNKLDIISFLGNYCGIMNKNLTKTFTSGCHTSPSTVTAKKDYTYTLNSEGFVTEKITIYTPSYHATSQKPNPEKIITTYEYIYQE